MKFIWKISTLIAALTIAPSTFAKDECQPWTWNAKRDIVPGRVVCRYTLNSGKEVNYYTCTDLANKYEITLETFFRLNPDVDEDCQMIKPNTEYCVAGFIEKPLATDGLCGPKHNNATCAGTEKQCCNSETWTCGDTKADCLEGTCYEGACRGAEEYAIDGKCGTQHGNLKCGGKWGSCCSNDGVCGSTADFCGIGKCQSGNCTTTPVQTPPVQQPWLFGNSTDGTCGGTKAYVCNPVYGYCCGKDGLCGDSCGTGCQPQFGKCDS